MSDVHERVLPRLHGRLHETRQELERITEIAVLLARALEDEVDARHGHSHVAASQRRRNTGRALHEARKEGLL